MSADEKIPLPFTEQEAWIVDYKVVGIKTSYKMLSEDSSQDYITLTEYGGKSVTWQVETFRRLARLSDYVSNTSSLVEPKEYGLHERIKARREWERKESKDLAEYKRLKDKFGGQP